MEPEGIKFIARNKKAYYDYFILDKYEAGLVLQGTEVKSLRDGRASIAEGYGKIVEGEVFAYNVDIGIYANAGPANHEAKRPRKLLLKRAEIRKISVQLRERGLTLIPLSMYFKMGFAKLEIGVAKGKKKYDKRESIARRDAAKEIRRRTSRR